MSVNKYNSEGYYDPTAYEALTIIDREISQSRYTRPRRYMPKVYICSPFRGDVANNVIKTRAYCSFAVKQGRIPFASHLLFPQFMSDSDPNERNLALFMALVYLDCCKECWVFGDTISEGMENEIRYAKRKNIPMRYFTEDCTEVFQ